MKYTAPECPRCQCKKYLLLKMRLLNDDEGVKTLQCRRCGNQREHVFPLVSSGGNYAYVWVPERKITLQFHHWVWETANNDSVGDWHVVHHINFDKRDNRPSNLRKMSDSDHASLHRTLRHAKALRPLSIMGQEDKAV